MNKTDTHIKFKTSRDSLRYVAIQNENHCRYGAAERLYREAGLTEDAERCLRMKMKHGDGEPFKVGDLVEVLDPGLAMLRDLYPDMPPNHHGSVGEIWDDGQILVYFPLEGKDHSQGAPYPVEMVRHRVIDTKENCD